MNKKLKKLLKGNKKKKKKICVENCKFYKDLMADDYIINDDQYEASVILENLILDRIEDVVDKNGDCLVDGEDMADIISYYIAGDPRYRILLGRALAQRNRRPGKKTSKT